MDAVLRPTLEPLRPADVRTERDALEQLYFAAFSPPPYVESRAEAQAFGALAQRDAQRPGYVAYVARAATPERTPIGLVYGYQTPSSPPGGDWWDRLLAAVEREGAERWILGQFAFCWFAVVPEAQGMGIGGALYDAVMRHVATPRAWLVTHGDPSPARAMYDRRGWREIARAELGWVPGERAVMGLERGSAPAPRSLPS